MEFLQITKHVRNWAKNRTENEIQTTTFLFCIVYKFHTSNLGKFVIFTCLYMCIFVILSKRLDKRLNMTVKRDGETSRLTETTVKGAAPRRRAAGRRAAGGPLEMSPRTVSSNRLV